jgi:NAD(P)H-hydrate epimerase
VIDFLNDSGMELVSIDLPSGLFCDGPTAGDAILKAHRTFTFQTPKLAFFLPENAAYLGAWAYGSIGLHPGYEANTETSFYYSTLFDIKPLRKVRTKFAHKGTYGHALLIAGSWGKIGASVLAARACLRSGVGLLSVHVPRCGQMVLQNAVPEAMVQADQRAKFWAEMPDIQGIASIGAGPGIGRAPETAAVLKQLLQTVQVPLVLDADALNLVSENGWLNLIPANTIITPHPKEFERLFGKTLNGFERLDLQRNMAQKYGIYIILKGANTSIACPNGDCWFNSTGNPGMATGGSGDVLTGILTGLLAQGYTPQSACLLGVFLHGLAGDLAAEALSQEALIAGDLVDFLGKAWLKLT